MASAPSVTVLWVGPAKFLTGSYGAHVECPFCSERHFHRLTPQEFLTGDLTGEFGRVQAPCRKRTYTLVLTEESVVNP